MARVAYKGGALWVKAWPTGELGTLLAFFAAKTGPATNQRPRVLDCVCVWMALDAKGGPALEQCEARKAGDQVQSVGSPQRMKGAQSSNGDRTNS